MGYKDENSTALAIQVSMVLTEKRAENSWDWRSYGRNTTYLFYQEHHTTTNFHRDEFAQGQYKTLVEYLILPRKPNFYVTIFVVLTYLGFGLYTFDLDEGNIRWKFLFD